MTKAVQNGDSEENWNMMVQDIEVISDPVRVVPARMSGEPDCVGQGYLPSSGQSRRDSK